MNGADVVIKIKEANEQWSDAEIAQAISNPSLLDSMGIGPEHTQAIREAYQLVGDIRLVETGLDWRGDKLFILAIDQQLYELTFVSKKQLFTVLKKDGSRMAQYTRSRLIKFANLVRIGSENKGN